MKCPICNNEKTKVIDSRVSEKSTRRRRMCEGCGFRFTTYEMYESKPIVVNKKDGSTEIFDKNKLLSGLVKACEKRPLDAKVIADEIETAIRSTMKTEITSNRIGEIVMEKLRSLDAVAYVRFASVYRQFKDINTFMDELAKLLGEK